MSDREVCPNQDIAKHMVTALESLRDKVGLQVSSLAEDAAKMNRIATEDPLVTLGAKFSLEEINDATVAHTSNFGRIDVAVTAAIETVDAPCPGREACAKACLKRTVVMEAASIVRELADPTRPEYPQ